MSNVASRLLSALAYPRAFHDFVELAFPLHASHEIRARVERVIPETHDTATLVLRPSRRFARHRAGQYVALTAEIDGTRRTRTFSIASGEAPTSEDDDARTIAITVKARPGGTVTPRLVSGELAGQIVVLSQPTGDFVLPTELPERLLLLSGGSGITPVMSMLRTLLADGCTKEIVFLHWARSDADVIFGSELARMRRSAPLSTVIEVRTDHFRPEHLSARISDFARWDTWACGPAPFLDAVNELFARGGGASRVRTERFSLSTGPSPSSSSTSDVTFTRSRRQARGGGPLLALAEGAGLSPPSGCRMGICHTCVCRKVAGTTRNLRTGEISTDDDTDIQLCVSEAIGPVALDL